MKIPNDAPPSIDPARHSLFLELDGTLLEFAGRPDLVRADDELNVILRLLNRKMNGAVAVITGRSVEDADGILGGVIKCLAGVHGLELRIETTLVERCAALPLSPDARDRIRKIGCALGALVEEKKSGLALHFREQPHYSHLVRRAANELAEAYGLRTIHGKMVAEILTAAPNKGNALATLSREPRFHGRLPIAVGDDATHEDAFSAAIALGGFAVLVGEPRESHANYRVRDVAGVRTWLKSVSASPS